MYQAPPIKIKFSSPTPYFQKGVNAVIDKFVYHLTLTELWKDLSKTDFIIFQKRFSTEIFHHSCSESYGK